MQQKAGTLTWEAVVVSNTQTTVPDPRQPCPQVPASRQTGGNSRCFTAVVGCDLEKKGAMVDWQKEDTDGGLERNSLAAAAQG